MTFQDKLAVVTGAGSGIGRAVALALSRQGASVAAVDINAGSAQETIDLITDKGVTASAFQADTSSAADIDRAVAGAVEDLGPLEIWK